MDIDKLTEQILEITNNSDYGWIDLDSSDADRIRVALTKALIIPVVVGRSEQLQMNRGRTPTCAIHFIYCWQTLLLWKAKRKLVIGAKKESQQNKLTI
jgi:hypothetical protein